MKKLHFTGADKGLLVAMADKLAVKNFLLLLLELDLVRLQIADLGLLLLDRFHSYRCQLSVLNRFVAVTILLYEFR
ncbi:MAG: hypothetical protein IIA14_12115 [SAR324 cluster bacterium]|nr:hypothetical protein [SAR324 cluster bacterium]